VGDQGRAERPQDHAGDQRLPVRQPEEHLPGFAALKDDGSTTCASWIYSGIFPKRGSRTSAPPTATTPRRRPPSTTARPCRGLSSTGASPGRQPPDALQPGLARPDGTPWSVEKAWVWWDPGQGQRGDPATPHVDRLDVPDFVLARHRRPAEGGWHRPRRPLRERPLHHEGDGKGGSSPRPGSSTGRCRPTTSRSSHRCRTCSTRTTRPAGAETVGRRGQRRGRRRGPGLPLRADHLPPDGTPHLRGDEPLLPWLAELQPELFVEISPELAPRRGRQHGVRPGHHPPRRIQARLWSPPASSRWRSPARRSTTSGCPGTGDIRAFVTGPVTNDLSLMVGDPNVSIHEGKAFVCNLEKA
jgi:formate dehydrogenase major subunit